MTVPLWFVDDQDFIPQLVDTDAWDRIVVADIEFNETEVEIDGDFGNEWDVKKSPGADGAPATNKGYEPCKPKVSWLLYRYRHWESYQELLAKVQPKPGKTPPVVVDVIHPQLQLFKKQQFRIAKVHTLKKAGPQIMKATFELLEYFAAPKPAPKPATPKEVPQSRERAVFDTEFFKPSNSVKP